MDGPLPPQVPDGPPPGPPRRFEKSALAFYGLLLLLLLPGILAQRLSSWAGLLWTEVFGFLLPSLVVAYGSNLRPVRYLKMVPVKPGLVLLSGIAGAGGAYLALALQVTLQRLMPQSWFTTFDISRLFLGPDWKRFTLAAITTLVAPLCEETAFRGYLLTTLGVRFTERTAIVLVAVLFAAAHLDPVRFLGLMALGILWGWLTVRSGSIWPAVTAHAVNNGLAAYELLSSGAAPSGADTTPFAAVVAETTVLGLALIAPALVVFHRAAKRQVTAADPLELRDPADPSRRFRWALVPERLRFLTAVGAAALALIGLLA